MTLQRSPDMAPGTARPTDDATPAATPPAGAEAGPVPVRVRYFAGAKAAAGVAEEQFAATDVADLLERLAAGHGDGLARVLAACSYLVDGVAVRDRSARLAAGATVDVLPPFAGG